MGYTPTVFNEGAAPGLSAAEMNKLGTQYAEAIAVSVLKSLYDAHTILIAVSDNSPIALSIPASRIVGRGASGNIVALTGAEVLAMIGRIGKGNFQWAADKLLLGAGPGVDPTEIDISDVGWFPTGNGGTKVVGADCAVALKDPVVATPGLRTLGTGAQQAAPGNHTHTIGLTVALVATSINCNNTSWTEVRSVSIPANAKKVIIHVAATAEKQEYGAWGSSRALYNGVERCSASSSAGNLGISHWGGDGVGSPADLIIEGKAYETDTDARVGSGAHYVTI